jgi:ubiquilin
MLRSMPNAREMLQSPMFRHMMTNPDMLRMATRMRQNMGGADGTSAFPAPGATDNTPADAPASGNGPAGAGRPMPPGFPIFPMMPPPTGGQGTGATNADNPFYNILMQELMQQGGAPAQTPPSQGATAPGTTASDGPASPPGSAPPMFGMTMEQLNQMMQHMYAGGGNQHLGSPFEGLFQPQQQQQPPDNRPPEERYAEQLRQLNDMGFYDFDQNVAALRRSGGSVQGALQHLLGD